MSEPATGSHCVELSRWLCAAAAVQGIGHEESGTPCEDASAITDPEEETIVAVVSDGVGSAPEGRVGAYTAAAAVRDYLASSFEDAWAESDLGAAVAHCVQSALLKRPDCGPLDSYACTLLTVGIQDHRYLAAHCGDGVIGICKNGAVETLSGPDRGEFAHQTFSVTSANAAYRTRIYKGDVGDVDGFVLLTDGAAESLYSRREGRFASAVNQIFGWPRDHPLPDVEQAIGRNLRDVVRMRTFDDCAIALISRVCLTTSLLKSRPFGFTSIFLGTGNGVGVKNRIAVAETAARLEVDVLPEHLADSIAEHLGLGTRTVRKHLEALKEIHGAEGTAPANPPPVHN